jgi:hypothetical protein
MKISKIVIFLAAISVANVSLAAEHVRSYTKKNGTHVASHTRKSPTKHKIHSASNHTHKKKHA